MDPIIFLVIASYFLVFGVGYIAGKISIPSIQPMVQHPRFTIEKPVIQKNISNIQESNIASKIEIDDRMFITEVKTDSLEKKFNDLGKTTVSKDENLSANVSKLASLKKSKED